MPVDDRICASLVAILPRLQRYARGPLLRRIYWALFALWESDGPPVRTTLHGFSVLLNRGNTYPFLLRGCPHFNAPLVELVHQVFEVTNSALTLVDVGAATGDTVLLIKQRCPGNVRRFICIEGEREFAILLRNNMRQFDNVDVIHTLLAAESTMVRSLVKHHRGSATAIGANMLNAASFDSLEYFHDVYIDILKIDVDGFDGEVITGAKNTLRRCRPAVIFEWHPALILGAGNDPCQAFEALADCGYKRYLWFKNTGTFSHFSGLCSRDVLDKHVRHLVDVHARTGEHFDIVALHSESKVSELSLAALNYFSSEV